MKNRKIVSCGLLLTIAIFFSNGVQGQNCSVQVTPITATINCGDSIDLSAYGSAVNPVFSEDFNNSSLGPGWSSSTNIVYNNPCSPPPDGSPAAWMALSSTPRFIETSGFDLSCGGQVCFELDFAADESNNICEDPDLPNEGVYFEYSTNGGATWTTIFYFEPTPNITTAIPSPYFGWDNYCFTIPPGAISPNTMFRWYQATASGQFHDNWGIDNVVINAALCGYYYDWDNIPGSNDPTSQTVAPNNNLHSCIYEWNRFL